MKLLSVVVGSRLTVDLEAAEVYLASLRGLRLNRQRLLSQEVEEAVRTTGRATLRQMALPVGCTQYCRIAVEMACPVELDMVELVASEI